VVCDPSLCSCVRGRAIHGNRIACGLFGVRALGAELAITYVNDKTRTYVEPLAREAGASIFLPLNFQIPGQLEQVFERITRERSRRLTEIAGVLAKSPEMAGLRAGV
jgi:enoyl-[acyl-carrier-protein] reductase (NADH)